MKTLMIVSALTLSLATAVSAADFEQTGVDVVLERNNMTFGLETIDGEAASLNMAVTILPHELVGANADLTLGAEYDINSEDFTVSASYELSKRYGQTNVYADMGAAYTITSGANDGNLDVTPTVGAAYTVNDNLIAFTEVGYTWGASYDWVAEGGTFRVGARYGLNDTLALTPSIVSTFDTGAVDATNLNLEVALRF